jgi:type IV pilus assembly protein PilP
MMRRRSIALSLCGPLLLAIACGTATVGSWAAEVKAPPTSAAKPAVKSAPAAPQPSAPYLYHSEGKPDPFYPFIETELAIQKKREEALKKKSAMKGGPVSPLQQSEIGQFRLVGIAGDDKRRTAVVEDDAVKKFYPLFVGTVIGPNEGRVAEILPDRVIVEERIDDPNPKAKKAQVRRVTMMLRKEE